MDKKINLALSIDGSSDYLSIAILDKIKIVKVKHYKLQNVFNFDDYFVNICDFLKKEYNFNSLYVGCGPGSFSGVRKTISFAKALKFSKGEKFSVIGINSLAALAYNYVEKYQSTKSKYILVLKDTKCNDFFVQLFETTKEKCHFTICPTSKIEIKKLTELEKYVDDMKIKKEELTVIGIPEFIFKKNIIKLKTIDLMSHFSTAASLGKLGFEIKKKQMKLNSFTRQHNFFNFDLNPIYAKSAKTN